MRILFLAPYLPFPPRGGGQQRIYHLLRGAAERHDVHLLTLIPPDLPSAQADAALAALGEFCSVEAVAAPRHTSARRLRTLIGSWQPDMVLRGASPPFAHALDALLGRFDFDVIQAESIEMAQYGRNTTNNPTSSGRSQPLFCYDAFNAEYLLQRRAFLADLRRPRSLPLAGYSLIQWRKLLRYERGLGRRFDLLFAVSRDDRQTLARVAPGARIEVVPNGVDTEHFRRGRVDGVDAVGFQPFLLFTGTLDFRPNVDAVTWFVRTIWPALHRRRPRLRFCVVGQRPAPQILELGRVPGVEIVGPVADIRPWFEAAAAYVLPMRIGGGVRLKLLETWSMELPCVTTTMGAEGVPELEPGRHALVADESAAFAAEVERLLDDGELARRIAAAARSLVVAAYDWRPIVTRMERAWEDRAG